jgi:hypothetical protein
VPNSGEEAVTGEQTVETRLADLQKTVEVGFATMNGEMKLFAERDRVAAELHTKQAADFERLREQVSKQDRKIAWAYGAAAGLSSASGLIVWALTHR